MLNRNDGGAWGKEPSGDGDIMVLRSTEQTVDGQWKIAEPAYRSLTRDEHESTCLIEGDLLVTKSSGSETHIGKTTIVDAQIAAHRPSYSNFMQRLRVEEGIHPKFVWYLLNSREAKIQLNLEATTSTGLANLNGGLLGRLVFPAPRANEQSAIASYLDAETARIDALVREKQRLLATLPQLRQTRISEIMTGTGRPSSQTGDVWLPSIPQGWTLMRLKHLGQVRSGMAKGKRHEVGTVTTELPYLRVANVQDGRIDLSDVATIEVAVDDIERFSLAKGDVLMNEGGDYDKLGRGAVWQGEIEPCLHQNHVFAVRLDDPTWGPWVAGLTRTAYARFYFMNNSKQSTNLASISQTNVKELPVVLPPANQRDLLLKQLDEELSRIEELTVHVEAEVKLLQELRATTITDAVLGRIDVRAHMKH